MNVGCATTCEAHTDCTLDYYCNEGGSPERDDFDIAAHLAGIADLAKLGVTWVGVGMPGRSIEHAVETLERYGREVISQARSIG